MATAQQGMNPQFAGGNLTIPGYRWQDRFSYQGQQGGWRLLVQSAVSQQTDGQTWLYFLCQTQQASATTITAQQAISKGIARTYLQSNASIRQLTTGVGQTNSDYQGVTRFRDISVQYPPNNGGNQYFYIYVVLMNSAGTSPAQQTAYRCTIANANQYTQIVNTTNSYGQQNSTRGLITLTYQDNVTGTIIDTPSQNYVNTLASTLMTSTDSPYQRQVTGVANDGNVYYAVNSSSSFTNFSTQAAGRTLTQSVATRSWYRATQYQGSYPIGVFPIVLVGDETTYYCWTRGYYGGDKTQLSHIQANTTSIWDRTYHVSQSSDRYWTTYRAQDLVQLPTTSFQITSVQVQQSSGTQNVVFQVPIQYASGNNTYKWTASSTNYQAQAAGTQAGYQQTQLNVVNQNNVFSDVGGSQRTLYLWVRYRYQQDQVYYSTGESITVETQGSDSDPDNPVLQNSSSQNSSSVTQAQTSTYYYRKFTTTGISSGVQVTWTADQGGQLSTQNYGTYSSTLQRSLQQVAWLRLQSSSSSGTTVSSEVTSGTASAEFQVTTAGGSGGGQGSGGGGQASYGLKVFNSQGNVIMTPTERSPGMLYVGNTGSVSTGNYSAWLTAPGVSTATGNADEIGILVPISSANMYSVTYQRGTNQFRFYNQTGSTINGKYYIFRV